MGPREGPQRRPSSALQGFSEIVVANDAFCFVRLTFYLWHGMEEVIGSIPIGNQPNPHEEDAGRSKYPCRDTARVTD